MLYFLLYKTLQNLKYLVLKKVNTFTSTFSYKVIHLHFYPWFCSLHLLYCSRNSFLIYPAIRHKSLLHTERRFFWKQIMIYKNSLSSPQNPFYSGNREWQKARQAVSWKHCLITERFLSESRNRFYTRQAFFNWTAGFFWPDRYGP